jgi:hypothetical protein
MNTSSTIWWIGPIVVTVLRMLSVEARLAHAEVKKSLLVFRGGLAMRILLAAEVIGFSIFIATGFYSDQSALAILAGFVVLSCFAWPATITLSDVGIEKRHWWRRAIRIPWSDVCGIERNSIGELGVYSRNGDGIDFGRYQVDPLRFEQEVMKRAKLAKVIDASAPPNLID